MNKQLINDKYKYKKNIKLILLPSRIASFLY